MYSRVVWRYGAKNETELWEEKKRDGDAKEEREESRREIRWLQNVKPRNPPTASALNLHKTGEVIRDVLCTVMMHFYAFHISHVEFQQVLQN